MAITLTKRQEEAIELMLSHSFTMLYGSSRSGKTFAIIILMLIRAVKHKSRHAILRFRFSHVKQSIAYDTLPAACELMGIEGKWNKSDWFFILPNGSEIWLGGMDDKERIDKILGNQYSTIFINEASQTSYDAYTTILTRLAEKSGLKNRLFIDQNPPSKSHWTYKLFIEKKNPETKDLIPNPDQYASMHMSVKDNLDNIGNEYIAIMESLTGRKRKRFLLGEFSDEDSGALFSEGNINRYRVIVAPELIEIIIAIDPSVTAKITSDETGIVVVGKGIDGRGYLLDDKSGIYTPKEWGTIAVALYKKWEAKYIVAEKNQGGDLISHTINTIDLAIPVRLVHASKGKIARAEPISALYENGKISHVGTFVSLEEELTTYTGSPNEKSPNRFDACIWGFSFLFPIEYEVDLNFEWN